MGLHCVEKPIMRMKVKNEKNELCQGTIHVVMFPEKKKSS